ncbi:hypothetical protein GCM10023258_27950 [Terrabacter aeriphilus]|uniref:Uncharacterized protein n=1 Tax=Terrabacter aeriphilus TaxID=515662 RepID=A0ABP9JFQ1_9MICO
MAVADFANRTSTACGSCAATAEPAPVPAGAPAAAPAYGLAGVAGTRVGWGRCAAPRGDAETVGVVGVGAAEAGERVVKVVTGATSASVTTAANGRRRFIWAPV